MGSGGGGGEEGSSADGFTGLYVRGGNGQAPNHQPGIESGTYLSNSWLGVDTKALMGTLEADRDVFTTSSTARWFSRM